MSGLTGWSLSIVRCLICYIGFNKYFVIRSWCLAGDLSAGEAISSVPSTLTVDLDGSEYLLILGSDGLYDAFDGKDLFDRVEKFVKSRPAKGEN